MAGSEWTVDSEAAGERLDKFLAAADRLGSRTRAAEALDRGKVFLNGREVGRRAAAHQLTAGDVVRLWIDRPGTARRRALGHGRPLPILYEDDVLIVVNKPAGLLAVPLDRRRHAPSVYDELVQYLKPRGGRRPLVVHRIDRDTSGIVVFAKRADVQQRLKDQFRHRSTERVYHAIVSGRLSPPSGTWRDLLTWDERELIQKSAHPRDPRAKEAISRYRVVESFRAASLIEVQLVTGKRNQIRVQAGLRGHPLIGERLYVDRNQPQTLTFPRQALHASRLTLRHPVSGKPMTFDAPLADDLVDLLERFRRPSR